VELTGIRQHTGSAAPGIPELVTPESLLGELAWPLARRRV